MSLCKSVFPLVVAAALLPAAARATAANAGAKQAARPAAKPAAAAKAHLPKLTAKQIVDRAVAARGGLKAWRAVRTMTWSGKMDVGAGDSTARSEQFVAANTSRKSKIARAATPAKDEPRPQVQVPFVLELKRPGRSRVEIAFAGKTAVQIWDGKSGWLRRPFLNRDDWEPFTAEQARSQQGKWELGGPLVDHAAKGIKVELAGSERVDGRDVYKLKLTRKGGEVQHVWIDAKTFLDVRVEGTARRLDGKAHPVLVTQRDFRAVKGLMVPFVQETRVDGYPDAHRVTLEKVAVNPPLDDARFAKPRT